MVARRVVSLNDQVPEIRTAQNPTIHFRQVSSGTWVYRRRIVRGDGSQTVSTPFMLIGRIEIGDCDASVAGYLPLEGVAWPVFAVGFSLAFAFIDPVGGWLCAGAFLALFGTLSLVMLRYELRAFERATDAMLQQLGLHGGA